MATLVSVAKTGEIPAGCGKVVEAAGKTLALFNQAGQYFALDNTCPHAGGPLGEGSLEGNVVTCPWHAWGYEVATGTCQTVPGVAVHTFHVEVEGDDIRVAV